MEKLIPWFPMPQVSRVLVFFWILCISLAATAQDAAKTRIDFVYFGDSDCTYCRAWEARDLPKLKESKSFQQIRFTKVTKSIRSPVPFAFFFPAEIKHLRDPIADKIKGAGSPMFAILTDGQVVASWKGTSNHSPDQIIKIIEQQQGQLSSGAGTIPNSAVNSVVAQ